MYKLYNLQIINKSKYFSTDFVYIFVQPKKSQILQMKSLTNLIL